MVEKTKEKKKLNMTCGLYDMDGHENHFCYKCKNISFLGFGEPDRPCNTCLDLGNCNFETGEI